MKELEIYIHIPFCVKKCAYCDFLSGPSTKEQRERYVELLVEELLTAKGRCEGYQVSTIFLGGGTPSILTGEQLEKIMNTVYEVFDLAKDVEITMEANPGTVTMEKLTAYKKAGINRLSIGLQSVHNEELKLLGRIHTYEDFLSTYKMAKEAGFENINVDLISAIPGQSVASWEESLRTILKLDPGHISAYSLIVEPGTPFYELYGEDAKPGKDVIALPTEDEERQMYYKTDEVMKEYGYERYEISNYAKKGKECRHNIGYWKRTDYLGFGIGAASLFQHTRYTNPENVEEYKEKFLAKFDGEPLERKEEMEECMFLGLRMMEGISKKKFYQDFHQEYDEVYGKVTKKLIGQGLIEEQGDRVFLTEKGIDVSNVVFLEFF